MTSTSHWYESFFEGVVVDLWVDALPVEHNAREAGDIARMLGVSAGAEILDVPCGGGRLSLPMAERGYRVTGVDLSPQFLAHARGSQDTAPVIWEHRDMRDLPWTARFDGAFCAGNSFGYLDDEGDAEFLRAVRRTLKPGARFVLETPMVLENVLGHIQERPWWGKHGLYLLAHNQYEQTTGRLEIEYTFIRDGVVDVRHGSHRAYPYRELVALLQASGFAVTTDVPWRRDQESVYFVATAVS